MAQNMNQFLTEIVDKTQGELESIIIFDINQGLPIYVANTKDQKRHFNLFGNNDIGTALQEFDGIKKVQNALDSFGKFTKFGILEYSIFKLDKGLLMVYFNRLPDTTVAICFLADENILLGRLISLGKANIEKIIDNLGNMQ